MAWPYSVIIRQSTLYHGEFSDSRPPQPALWEKDILCKGISSPAHSAFVRRPYPLPWFLINYHVWWRDRLFDKESPEKESHLQNIFTVFYVI